MGDRLNPVEGQHIFTTVFITFPRFFLAQAPGKPCRSQTNRSCCKIAILPIPTVKGIFPTVVGVIDSMTMSAPTLE